MQNLHTEVFVHGTCRKFAARIIAERCLRSAHQEIWAAVDSENGCEIAAFFAREAAAREGDEPVLVYFRTDAIADELRYWGEAVDFYEWEHCWQVPVLPIEVVGPIQSLTMPEGRKPL